MQIRPLAVPDCFEVTPRQHGDDRGIFLEWFRFDELEAATGRSFALRQANLSTSRKGVARGIHCSNVPPGQAKYVTVVAGAVTDYMIDLRVGSPTFGTWDSVELDDVNRKAVFIPEGIGHMFVVSSESAAVSYLTTDVYRPDAEFTISPVDNGLGLRLPVREEELVLSPKDLAAPSLAEAMTLGILPSWDACLDVYRRESVGVTR